MRGVFFISGCSVATRDGSPALITSHLTSLIHSTRCPLSRELRWRSSRDVTLFFQHHIQYPPPPCCGCTSPSFPLRLIPPHRNLFSPIHPALALAYRRTPSASERVIEEALSTASRFLERLVRSARLHQDASFLPPSPSASVDIDDQRAPAAGESDRYFDGGPAGYVPGGGGAAGGSSVFGTRYGHDGGHEPTDADSGWPGFRGGEGENHHRRRWQGMLWEQQQRQQQQAGVPQDQRMRTTTTPGDAAVATLLSFRYPRSSPTVRFTASGAASTARDGGLGGKRGAAGEVPEEFGKAGPGGSGGLSVCGALFALFLSACPLLGYPAADNARVTLGSGGGWVSRGEEEGGRPASEPSGVPSRVAVLAGEVLQVRGNRLFFLFVLIENVVLARVRGSVRPSTCRPSFPWLPGEI